LGIAGWKWMFIAEAIPTVLVGFFFLIFVTDRPHQAHWLTEQERNWLINTLEDERKLIEAKRKVSLWQSFWDPRVLILTLNYFGIVTASLGLLLFLPQMVKQLGVSNMQVGWVSMIPYAFGALSMVAWGWVSDRMGERRWNLCVACVVATIGLYGTKGPFWTLPSMILTGSAAASGIAWINGVGNLGGFFGPTAVGWIKTYTGSFASGLYLLAGLALVSAVSTMWLNFERPVTRPGQLAGVPAV
jgi:ACS family tartrate transporter-like MFS transporter